MKKQLWLLPVAILTFSLVNAPAQTSGPQLGGATSKLFGENQTYTATLEIQTTSQQGNNLTMPGKISFDSGKSSFALNMTEVQGSKMPPATAAQMKEMGMDQMVSLSLPDKKTAYLIYPGMKSYIARPMTDEATTPVNDYQVTTTELGKEVLDGHDCTKNKVVVTGKDGTTHGFTVWNATDLNKFPVKIQGTEQGQNTTMLFKNISLAKPDASAFEVPASYTKYNNLPALMQAEMMKKLGNNMRGVPGN
ncbi:MAG TPA: hypothetical protein VIK53_15315 [Verrucomicrobiae bacterium]